MTAYLRIENIGVAPADAFTVLGVSMADQSNNAGMIGQFGSGSKHSIALLLRNELQPIVFAAISSWSSRLVRRSYLIRKRLSVLKGLSSSMVEPKRMVKPICHGRPWIRP